MKRKILNALLALAVIQALSLSYGITLNNNAGLAYADDHRGRDRDRDRDHGRHYKHHRYYPRDFFFPRTIFYGSKGKFCFFYDIYPRRVYYYPSEEKTAPENPNYLSIVSIANMSAQGVPDDVIIDEIRKTRSVYQLTSATISYLRQNNASDRLINYMLDTGRRRG